MPATLHNDLLTLTTGVVTRTFAWNGGDLLPRTLTDARTGVTWHVTSDEPALHLPGHAGPATDATFRVEQVADDTIRPAHEAAVIEYAPGTLHVRRVFRLFPGCPAIEQELHLRGRVAGRWVGAAVDVGSLRNIEDAKLLDAAPPAAPLLERFAPHRHHTTATAVQFFDITDRRNNLVAQQTVAPYRHPLELRGNLLVLRDTLDRDALFVLKLAPCSDVQLADPGYDFAVQRGLVAVAGLGLTPADVREDQWVQAYGVVVGVAGRDSDSLLHDLRRYQRTQRTLRPGRDHMIMLNTWGDRGQDRHVGHDFALREIDRAAAVGVSHFQLDDGWQKGQSANSAFAGGTLDNIWRRDDYWHVSPQRFPQGLAPVIAHAKSRGVELCLWFNPSKDDSYAHWQRDADALIALHREHGVRTFKIDGVVCPDKRAADNLCAMFDAVMEATRHQAVFNLDVTAGKRFGYHHHVGYGNLFLENRYTDWTNYYPHWTLRNLWQLSRWVPPQRLQVEFLNPARNAEKYPAGDPLAPRHVPLAYCFAVTMMAQPLAWMEMRNLTDAQVDELKAVAPIYREHQQAIHAGDVAPIGEEPDGTAWTGFTSTGGPRPYAAIYREWNTRETATLQLPKANWRRSLGSVELHGDTVRSAGPFAFGLFVGE